MAQLQGLRAMATLDRFPGLGHGIDGRAVDAIVRRLNEAVVPSTWLQFGEEAFVVRARMGDRPEAERRLDLGAARIARYFFHHDPPTAPEIERAIDATEDEIMRLGPRALAAGPLCSNSPALRPWAAVCGPLMSVELVESWFSRLALAAQGQPQSMQGLPAGREAAATLLVLREFMHHRGHPSIEYLEPQPGPS
ncbi:MAG: hypothetical protein KGL18_02565 [Burkholderiales bacterium]|nr:hypothetical protein [Burkholderiales bacterium]MDE1926175.1 hypothetical protein [Burkholderiales bacterium]MDE2501851.1 hypothetical protein [Burkholderiales bacterium]